MEGVSRDGGMVVGMEGVSRDGGMVGGIEGGIRDGWRNADSSIMNLCVR